MEKTNMKHLSSTRCILLLLFYFVGYTYLLPRILTVLTLMVDPQATTFNIPISVVSYVMIMVFVIWVAKPIWLDSILQFKANWKKYLPMIFAPITPVSGLEAYPIKLYIQSIVS